MTNIDYPWDPPMAGTEVAHLTGALDRLRTTFRFKADDLGADGLQVKIGASALTLGGLLKHLAVCEDKREAVDGRVGEDPPAGWRPKAGRYRVGG